jgi:hypothetical protein
MGNKALERLRPGRRFTLPATVNNLVQPGDVIKFTFTNVASAEQILRFPPTNGWPLSEQYISIKVTADCHVVFGPAGGVTDPTNADALFQPGDSWQDFQLNNTDASFKVKGDVAGGDIYMILSSR